MSYKFMSNIKNFSDINNPNNAYLTTNINEEITFKDNDIEKKAFFLMIRAHSDNDLLIEILPYGYGVYVPANEMWSVDSIDGISGFRIKKAFNGNNSLNSAKVQWMIGYK